MYHQNKIKTVDFPIPRGYLGINTFRHILRDPRTQNIPLILETPSFEQPKEVWGKEIRILQTLAGNLEATQSEEDLQEEVRHAVKEAELRRGKGKGGTKSTKLAQVKSD